MPKKIIQLYISAADRKTTKNSAGCALIENGRNSHQWLVANEGDAARTEVAVLLKAITDIANRNPGAEVEVFASRRTAVAGIYLNEHSRPRYSSLVDGDVWKHIMAICKMKGVTLSCYSDTISPNARQAFRQANAYCHKERQGILTSRRLMGMK